MKRKRNPGPLTVLVMNPATRGAMAKGRKAAKKSASRKRPARAAKKTAKRARRKAAGGGGFPGLRSYQAGMRQGAKIERSKRAAAKRAEGKVAKKRSSGSKRRRGGKRKKTAVRRKRRSTSIVMRQRTGRRVHLHRPVYKRVRRKGKGGRRVFRFRRINGASIGQTFKLFLLGGLGALVGTAIAMGAGGSSLSPQLKSAIAIGGPLLAGGILMHFNETVGVGAGAVGATAAIGALIGKLFIQQQGAGATQSLVGGSSNAELAALGLVTGALTDGSDNLGAVMVDDSLGALVRDTYG